MWAMVVDANGTDDLTRWSNKLSVLDLSGAALDAFVKGSWWMTLNQDIMTLECQHSENIEYIVDYHSIMCNCNLLKACPPEKLAVILCPVQNNTVPLPCSCQCIEYCADCDGSKCMKCQEGYLLTNMNG
jgi:hypothetical protein